jgi:hypothetical protein
LWAGRTLYEIELAGEIVEDAMKVVAPRGRLLRRIEAWDDALRDEYTRMCADRAHELARGASLASWDEVIEPSVPEGPALLGFVAARIAEEISGPAAYRAERDRQADWLAERQGAPGQPAAAYDRAYRPELVPSALRCLSASTCPTTMRANEPERSASGIHAPWLWPVPCSWS